MAGQRAVAITNWKGAGVEGDPFRPALVDLLQAGESLDNFDARANLDISVLANDACVVAVEGDEARISLMDGTAHRVLCKWYTDSNTPITNFDPNTPFSSAQVSALNIWMQTKYGVTGTQIAAWFGITAAQLSNWLQNHPKSEAVEKLIIAWRQKIWR